ncbi:sigma-70 family RNA polymerase sigma factor [Desulfonauticus submarinus]|uniref:RNA polymerase sigma factor n=1 Tax=Desulfonauticus submarinus TaxID=206665 RepID=A0A1H0CHI8_9BACT|nr:RNA polymerase factor sigma-32 [Desulfonauticus submarinus]SDN57354.1 RNA polymerase, sigma 32 subunit, RpoH [Desulfonauticus submarinus]
MNFSRQKLPQTLPEKSLKLKTNKGGYPQIKDSLSLYLKEINNFPILSPEEEIELAKRYHEKNDQEAAFKLITSNLRLVVKIAMDFQRRWMQNILDLIQEGNIGLMKAVQKFDPDKGIKFSYYASFWIKAYILKFIMDNWRMVKIGTTQAQRKLFYNLNKEKQRLEAMGIVPDAETISSNLNVSEKEVIEMGKRMGQQDLSLDMPLNDDEEFTPLHVIPALEGTIEEKLFQEETANILQEKLKTLLPKLNEKEKDILELRLLAENPLTLREIGEKYGITRERVRQIEARLLQKIKKHLKEEISDFSKDWILDA